MIFFSYYILCELLDVRDKNKKKLEVHEQRHVTANKVTTIKIFFNFSNIDQFRQRVSKLFSKRVI